MRTRRQRDPTARLLKDDEVYLTLGLIANYTDVQIQTFDSGDGRRVLINDWGTRNIARVKKAGSLRVKGGVKSKILTDLAKDDTVTVLDTMEKWSQVASSDGNIGYVEISDWQPRRARNFPEISQLLYTRIPA